MEAAAGERGSGARRGQFYQIRKDIVGDQGAAVCQPQEVSEKPHHLAVGRGIGSTGCPSALLQPPRQQQLPKEQRSQQVLKDERQRHAQPLSLRPHPQKQHLHIAIKQRALLPLLLRRHFLQKKPALQRMSMCRQRKEHPLPVLEELGEKQDQQGRDLALSLLSL